MAKDKSLKPDANPPKKKKWTSLANKDHVEEIMDGKVQKKRKKMEVEEPPVQIPPVTLMADDKKQKKDKKHKKKQMTEQTQTTKQTEEPPVQIPPVTLTADDKKQKKDKKNKKKHVTEQTQTTKQTEISDPPCRPEGSHKLEGEEDLSPEEVRVLERKMKKVLKKEEKKRLKAEGVTEKTEASEPTAPQQALDYLTCWAENRAEWKFQKTRQTWLLQHMFHSEKIPDEKFSVLLQYMEGLRGGARDTTVQKAMVLVEESGQAPEDSAVQQRAHRAREVIQLLS